MVAHRWLEPDLPLADRADLLRQAVADAGWLVVEGNGRYSRANPVTRTVTLRAGLHLVPPTVALVATLAHEATHVRQLAGPWWLRWLRGSLYLVSGVRRLCMEVEAEAEEAAARYVCTGSWSLTADTLSGWHRPYYTGAQRVVVEDATMAQARRLVG